MTKSTKATEPQKMLRKRLYRVIINSNEAFPPDIYTDTGGRDELMRVWDVNGDYMLRRIPSYEPVKGYMSDTKHGNIFKYAGEVVLKTRNVESLYELDGAYELATEESEQKREKASEVKRESEWTKAGSDSNVERHHSAGTRIEIADRTAFAIANVLMNRPSTSLCIIGQTIRSLDMNLICVSLLKRLPPSRNTKGRETSHRLHQAYTLDNDSIIYYATQSGGRSLEKEFDIVLNTEPYLLSPSYLKSVHSAILRAKIAGLTVAL